MSGTIGGVTCTFVRSPNGTIPASKKVRSEMWEVAGISGYGLLLTGMGDSAFQIVARLYSNNAGLNTWAASLQAMQGTIVSIVDDDGGTHSNCYVKQVSDVVKEAAYIPGSAITRRGTVTISGVLL